MGGTQTLVVRPLKSLFYVQDPIVDNNKQNEFLKMPPPRSRGHCQFFREILKIHGIMSEISILADMILIAEGVSN